MYKIANLTKEEGNFLTKYFEHIYPKYEPLDPSKWIFFDGEWVYIRGYGGVWFIPNDIESWNKAEKEGFVPIAKQDHVPYRTGRIIPRTIDEVPNGLHLSLGPIKEKYM